MAMPREPMISARPSPSTQVSAALATMKLPYQATCEADGVGRPEANAKQVTVSTRNASERHRHDQRECRRHARERQRDARAAGRDEVAEDARAAIAAARRGADERTRDGRREARARPSRGRSSRAAGRPVADRVAEVEDDLDAGERERRADGQDQRPPEEAAPLAQLQEVRADEVDHRSPPRDEVSSRNRSSSETGQARGAARRSRR